MLVVSWNIQLGGRDRQVEVAESLMARSPDLIVLGEYMTHKSAPLLDRLCAAGWVHTAYVEPPDRYGGVAVVSRHELIVRSVPPGLEALGFRYQAVGVPALDLELRAAYAPLHKDPYSEFWEAALRALENESGQPVLFLGDLNTGSAGVDSPAAEVFCERFFRQLPARGYVDLWRQANGAEARDYTWIGPVNPYRLDHAFGSSSVSSRLIGCTYEHSVRESKLSDHSLLAVELRG